MKRLIKADKKYKFKMDCFYTTLKDYDFPDENEKLKELGFIKDDKIIIPKGTQCTVNITRTFEIMFENGLVLDFLFDDPYEGVNYYLEEI
jgi:hypothetical protein